MSNAPGPVRPLPQNVDPIETICFKIDLPNDPQWIATYLDAVYTLTRWFAWGRDSGHTGRAIAARWLHVFNSIQLCQEGQAPSGCPDPGEDYLIRQNPDNPCLIETSADGSNWCTLIDITLCVPATGQPGSGARQPLAGGGQACYDGHIRASEIWLLPTVCNAGDVLSFSNIVGAGGDGSLHWYCPDGSIYFAGACVGSLAFDGADPAPALHHMAIVAKIGAVYYDITAGPITVPGGIANAPVYVQVNDSTLTNNSGDYTFSVCVTNNAATAWSHLLDFTLAPHGNVQPGSTGSWVAGTGIIGVTPDSANRVLRWVVPLPTATHITQLDITYTNNDVKGGTSDICRTYSVNPPSGTVIAHYNGTSGDTANVTNKLDTMVGDSPGTRSILIALDKYFNTDTDKVTSLLVYGTGPEPVWP